MQDIIKQFIKRMTCDHTYVLNQRMSIHSELGTILIKKFVCTRCGKSKNLS